MARDKCLDLVSLLVWPSFHHWGLEPLGFLVMGNMGRNHIPGSVSSSD